MKQTVWDFARKMMGHAATAPTTDGTTSTTQLSVNSVIATHGSAPSAEATGIYRIQCVEFDDWGRKFYVWKRDSDGATWWTWYQWFWYGEHLYDY